MSSRLRATPWFSPNQWQEREIAVTPDINPALLELGLPPKLILHLAETGGTVWYSTDRSKPPRFIIVDRKPIY